MSNKLPALIQRMQSFLENQFVDRDYFAIVYGSYAHGTERKTSDLDVLIGVRDIREQEIRTVADYIISLHNDFGLGLDYEIPYEYKLLIDYNFLRESVEGRGFRDSAGRVSIPLITKDPKFLKSRELLLRFFMACMTHKHIFLSGNKAHYQSARSCSIENLLRVILATREIITVQLEELVELYLNYNGARGDFYLGYEDRPHHREYLAVELSKLLTNLVDKGVVRQSSEGEYVFADTWIAQLTRCEL